MTLKEAVLNGVTMSCNTGESTMAAVSGYYPYWTLALLTLLNIVMYFRARKKEN